jgi:hypothetical protein
MIRQLESPSYTEQLALALKEDFDVFWPFDYGYARGCGESGFICQDRFLVNHETRSVIRRIAENRNPFNMVTKLNKEYWDAQ